MHPGNHGKDPSFLLKDDSAVMQPLSLARDIGKSHKALEGRTLRILLVLFTIRQQLSIVQLWTMKGRLCGRSLRGAIHLRNRYEASARPPHARDRTKSVRDKSIGSFLG